MIPLACLLSTGLFWWGWRAWRAKRVREMQWRFREMDKWREAHAAPPET